MQDIMIDIESTDVRFTAGVLTIGAVKFDRNTSEITDKFYRRLGYNQAAKYGSVDNDTLAWWQRQNPAVREEAFNGDYDAHIAAYELTDFCKNARGVWGNGALFDLGILDHWLHALEFSTAWDFNVRDCRTLVELAAVRGFHKSQYPRGGGHHNALDDAIYQAQYISGMWQGLTA